MTPLVGRARERERLDRLVVERGAALAVVGEPGIGKTALLDYARGRAERVLNATGAETERDLPFAGLLALLLPLLPQLDRLPTVQARALKGALALGPPAPADRFGVHAATLALLAAAADEQPLLMVVDDAHWLDEASAEALLFVARRLAGEPIALLFALRPAEGGRLDLAGVERLAVDGLARSETAELLRGVAPEVLDQLHAATAGNPLALLEAPAHLPAEQLAGRDPLGEPLPVGPGVQAGFRRRLEQLPVRTRTALLLAAAAGTEPLARIFQAGAELGVTLADLAPAQAGQLVELADDRVDFRHPLVRAAAYQDAPAPQRRAAHRALAAHTEGARRANHLWAAAFGADETAATALETAAAEARGRTGIAAAALALERAARLTAPGDARAARLLGAAQDRLTGGDAARAIELAHRARGEARDAVLRAEIDGLLGATSMLVGSLEEGIDTLSAAAELIAEVDPERGAWMLSSAAVVSNMAGRIPLGLEKSLRAYELGRHAGGSTELIFGLLLAASRIMSGQTLSERERALLSRWPETLDERILRPGAPHLIGQLPLRTWMEDYDAADAYAASVEAMVAETGAIGALPLLRAAQVEIDLRRGDWARARARASEAMRLSDETGQIVSRSLPAMILARLHAAMGLEAECRAVVSEMTAFAEFVGIGSANVYGQAALGLLELGLGRVERAAEHLDEAARLCSAYGQFDPSIVQHHPDRIEAHIRAGHAEQAEAALREFAAMAERTGRRWPLACVARCRGMLEDDFDAWFERAYDEISPFELGRSELVPRRAAAPGAPAARGARAVALGAGALRGVGGGAVGGPCPRRAARGRRRGPSRARARVARAHAAGARGRARGGRRGDQPGGGGGAVREPQDRRSASDSDLQEARRALADRAGRGDAMSVPVDTRTPSRRASRRAGSSGVG